MREFIALILILFSNHLSAQLIGKVIDKESNTPLPFVNIWYYNKENSKGATSNEKGEFKFNVFDPTKKLVFNKVGYQVLELKPDQNELKIELIKEKLIAAESLAVPSGKKKKAQLGLNLYEATSMESLNTTHQKPRIYVQYFSAEDLNAYQLDEIIVSLKSELKSLINIRIYGVNQEGSPENLLHQQEILQTVKAGEKIYYFKVRNLNIKMPRGGIFVGIETLLIDQNKLSFKEMDFNTDQEIEVLEYHPAIRIFKKTDEVRLYSYRNGDWFKVHEPAFSLGINVKLRK